MLRRFAVAVGLLTLIAGTVWVWFRPLPPFADPSQQRAQFLSSYVWTRDEEWFGGFSGLEIAEDGVEFHALTDRAQLIVGTLERLNDRLTGVTIASANTLRDDKGRHLSYGFSDAEGLAIAPDGQLNVSFEGTHRIWVYADVDAPAKWASYRTAWRAMSNNGGMEALAIDSSGMLWTVAESTGKRAWSTLVYTRAPNQKWKQPYVLPLTDRFLPVGADFGPDGRLYLLERDVYPFGFRSRVRVLSLGNDKILSSETVLHTSLRKHGNLEGLAVWVDAAGRTRLTMISDDNFLFPQQTQIVEYVLR